MLTITMQVWGWEPTSGWQYRTSHHIGRWRLPPGSYAGPVGAKVFQALWLSTSVRYQFRWRTLSGQLLGTKYLDHNAVSDYFCTSSCHVYPDNEVGAFIYYG